MFASEMKTRSSRWVPTAPHPQNFGSLRVKIEQREEREAEKCICLSRVQCRSIFSTTVHLHSKADILRSHKRLVAYKNKHYTVTLVIQESMKRKILSQEHVTSFILNMGVLKTC